MIDLLNGKVYECLGIEHGASYRIIDESGEDYLYPIKDSKPIAEDQPPGRWEIVEP